MVSLLSCVLAPVFSIHAAFLAFTVERRRMVGYNGQTICLRHLLNERFDPLLSQIYITNHVVAADGVYLAHPQDSVQFYLGVDAESGGYLAVDRELNPEAVNFTVFVPQRLGALLTDPAIRALIDNYKLHGTRYAIKTY